MSLSTPTTSRELSGAAVSAYRLVKLDSGKMIHTTAKTETAYGANGVDSASGADEPLAITPCGIVKLTAADAIVKGAQLMPAAAGKVITHDASATAKFVGQALEAAAADGDLILVLLYDNKNQVPDAT